MASPFDPGLEAADVTGAQSRARRFLLARQTWEFVDFASPRSDEGPWPSSTGGHTRVKLIGVWVKDCVDVTGMRGMLLVPPTSSDRGPQGRLGLGRGGIYVSGVRMLVTTSATSCDHQRESRLIVCSIAAPATMSASDSRGSSLPAHS